MAETPRMDIKEFQETGYLHEINRLFLHPLGLALEVIVDDDDTVKLGGVWDYRDDPEGIYFDDPDGDKIERIEKLWDERRPAREKALGYFIQPRPDPKEA